MFYARDIVIYRGDEVTYDAVKKMVANPPLDRDIKSIMQKRQSKYNILDLFFTGKDKFQYRLIKIKTLLLRTNGLVPDNE